MSSDPNTPDFDSMSPEEMMAWMESLAKRQGADASGFTTSADVEIDEVDPSTVDEEILNKQYRPDGWTEERWQAQLAKEEAEKQARLAAQQQAPPPEPVAQSAPPPEPEPEPEPAVASEPALGADGTPDFDSMSPEELMEWMESLAKRQGADEGFTTKAEMEVAEVDPSTVDEEILNKQYRPDGWTEERWQAQLAKEEAEKQARREAREQSTPQPIPEPEIDPMEDIEEEEDEQLAFSLPSMELDNNSDSDNPMSWLEDLAKTDEDSQELELPDLSGLGEDLGGLSNLAQDDTGGDPMDWLASLAGDADEEAPDIDLGDLSSGLEGLDALAALGDDDDVEDEDESIVSLEDVEQTDPDNFLESLARLQGAPEDELSTDATTPIPDFLNFAGADIDEDDEDEAFDFGDILEDTQPSEELEPAWDAEDPNSIENPEAWLDAIAGAANPSGTGQMNLLDDEDDYEDDEELLVTDENPSPDAVIDALHSGKDVAPEDIQGFFDAMFQKANTEYAHLDNAPIDDDDDDDEDIEEAVAIDMPDWLQELSGGGATQSADVDFDEEDEDEGVDLMADVLAGLEMEESPVEVEEELGEETVQLPDWLGEGSGDDTGDVIADIIADELDVPPGETAILSIGDKQIEVDPNDTWTQAFLMEDDEEHAEEWYTERLNAIGLDEGEEEVAQAVADIDEPILEDIAEDFETIQMTSPPGNVSLQPATFPIEEDLPEGEPEIAPEWLTGVVSEPVAEMPMDFAAMSADEDEAIEMPDWLNDSIDDEIEIPDWLTEAEDAETDDIPDWLADAGVEDVAEIPDWLTDTVEEPADFVLSEPEPAIADEPMTMSAIQPVQQMQPVQAPPPAADVAAAIQSAQSKVQGDDLDGALADYEAVVRANDGLDVVVSDLQKLTKNDQHKKNPAVYRVLGDAMMRKGDLQDALDVYRRALNLL